MIKRPARTAMAAALAFASSTSPAADSGYGDKVGLKFGSGYTNLVLGLVEIPKNMILTTNQTNALFGVTGGVAKGVIHGVGRTLAGVVDVLTFPIPTEPIPRPAFVWQDFQTETRYGPVLKP